jgi:hypothetical protein
MSAKRAGDVPTLGVLVTGGIGVLVVIAFVAGVLLGRDSEVDPADRVGVVRRETDVEVIAGRCPDERVRSVEVRVSGGPVLWRIESERGTIDREFIVGAAPPPLFDTTVEPQPLIDGALVAEVVIDDVVAAREFEVDELDESDRVLVSCDDGDLGVVPLLFVVGALGVVGAYGVMVRRFLRHR